jgi:hypothetical protein
MDFEGGISSIGRLKFVTCSTRSYIVSSGQSLHLPIAPAVLIAGDASQRSRGSTGDDRCIVAAIAAGRGAL